MGFDSIDRAMRMIRTENAELCQVGNVGTMCCTTIIIEHVFKFAHA